jgi:ABC-type sugar transport system ATPase subunit
MAGSGLELRVEGLSKSFGETRALRDVSLSVRPGTVHALIGENGAGKSTLGRIVSGVVEPDSGQVLIDGEAVQLRSPRDALDRGVATIAQEIALVPGLDAAANVFLGAEPRSLGLIQRTRLRAAYEQLAASVGFEVPAGPPVVSLSVAQQQEVEILRALSRNAGLIVMDEPTARLSAGEAQKLYRVIRELVASGRTVLLITHFLGEVLEVADEVTVLRDGSVVRSGPTTRESDSSLIEAMLGRKLGAQFPDKRPPASDAELVLEAIGIGGPGFWDVSLRLHAGEIIGLAGLVGAGRTELGRAIAGAAPINAGRLELKGRPVRFRSPREAGRSGLLMIPESRRDQGLFYLRSVHENVSISSLARFSRLGLIRSGAERRATDEMLDRVAIDSTAERAVANLSGGNQQKVLFARTMLGRPVVLLADEPTRGVDVGAKRVIYELLVELAASGMAILLISSEMEEILGLAHRVVVMRSGRVTVELGPHQLSEQAILEAVFDARAEEARPA